MADDTQWHLAQLHPVTAEQAYWLVWATRTVGYPVVITSSRRSRAEQMRLYLAGRTRTLRSKHMEGLAFDIDWLGTSRDRVPQWFWDLVGPWAEANLGLRWGGRFRSIYDPGHFETAV